MLEKLMIFVLGMTTTGFALAQMEPPTPPPPVSVSEPQTFLLLGAGVISVILARKFFK